MEKGFKTREQCWAGTGPGLHPMGHGGLPCAASRQAGWASAWMPGPAEEAARGVGTGRARWSSPWRGHRAWYGMVHAHRWLGGGWMMAWFSRGAPGGFMEGAIERREWWAHRGNGSTCGGGAEAVRRCTTVAEVLRRLR
jgi:hypothetical protein